MLFASLFYRATTGLYRLRAGGVSDEDGGEGACCVVLHARQDVLVGGHGEGGTRVAEALGDDLDRHPVTQQQAGVGVAKVMQSCSTDRAFVGVFHTATVERATCSCLLSRPEPSTHGPVGPYRN